MTKRRAISIWLLLIAVAALLGGAAALQVDLTEEAGLQRISVSMFDGVPVAAALLLLQGAGALVAALSSPTVIRLLTGFIAPLTLWHLILVLVDGEKQLTLAAEVSIAELTGVYGQLEQQGFVSSFYQSWTLIGYSVALAALIGFLTIVATRGIAVKDSDASPSQGQQVDSQELWESQRDN